MQKISRLQRVQTLLLCDKPYWERGIVIAGIDEAGRGSLAGSVVSACVVMPARDIIEWIDDSKKLTEKRRESVYEAILKKAVCIGVGEASPGEIDSMNILNATKLSMRRAAEQVPAELFLIDAVTRVGLSAEERPIVHGDAICYNIAAASIVAKVVRDRQMRQMHLVYPEYGFDRNKGYGTYEHIQALRIIGPCPEHRQTFIRKFIA
ncbi:MAG: ribonuclease HII [Clostridia bacterium]|nr:ribonuclease HII [Clostridia bacterium]